MYLSLAQRASVVGVIALLSSGESVCNAEAGLSKDQQRSADNAKAYTITQRLRVGLTKDKSVVRPKLKSQSDRNSAMDIFTLHTADGSNRFGKDGLPIARVAIVEINGEVKDVAAMYTDTSRRKSWDKSASQCTTIISKDDGGLYHYFLGKAGWLVPAREFLYTSVTLPPAVVGITSLSTVVIFHQDASSKYPAGGSNAMNVVLGEQNSMLVLEPIGLTKTRATLLVECDPKGWAWLLGSSYVDFLAGDSTVQSLLYLKQGVEDENVDDIGLSVEDIAQQRFRRKQARENSLTMSIVDDNISETSLDDLEQTIALLEARLHKLVADEKESGLNLNELKARVQKDLAKAKARVKGY